jgi:hypothetical protein
VTLLVFIIFALILFNEDFNKLGYIASNDRMKSEMGK